MGYFNYGQIDWEAGVVDGPEDSDAASFHEMAQDLFLFQHVHFPRFRDGCTPSRLDLVFSAEELMVDNMEVSSPVGKSDHVVLSWVFRYGNENSGERSRGQTKLNYRKGNYTDMSEALSQVNWDSIL